MPWNVRHTRRSFISPRNVSRNYAAIVRAIGDKHKCGGSRLDDSRLENGISLTVRGKWSRFRSRCRVNYEFIRSLQACLPIHRAISSGNAYSSRSWMFGSVIGSMILNDHGPTRPLNFHPFYNWPRFPSPAFDFPPAAYGNRRNALTDSINFRWPRKCPADSSPSTAWPVLL